VSAGLSARLLSFALSLATVPAAAAAEKPRVNSLSLFTIGKSQNKNQVQYAIHVDGQCVPVTDAPVFAYWRMLELGLNRVEPLLPRELMAYGLASQSVTARGADGGKVRLVLEALRDRAIVVTTLRSANGACRAYATVAISGSPAHLFDVYVKLTWRLSVEYLLLRGWSTDGRRILSETVSP